MNFKSVGLAVAALGLASAPIAAQTTASERAAPFENGSEIGGGDIGPVAIILALAGAGIGILLLTDDDDDDDAVST